VDYDDPIEATIGVGGVLGVRRCAPRWRSTAREM